MKELGVSQSDVEDALNELIASILQVYPNFSFIDGAWITGFEYTGATLVIGHELSICGKTISDTAIYPYEQLKTLVLGKIKENYGVDVSGSEYGVVDCNTHITGVRVLVKRIDGKVGFLHFGYWGFIPVEEFSNDMHCEISKIRFIGRTGITGVSVTFVKNKGSYTLKCTLEQLLAGSYHIEKK